jgi:hypothetical protein
MHSDREKRMLKYLLGQLREQDQIELERGYLADDALFEELLAIEDDLRDAYARNELSERDRTAFEQRFLATQQQRGKQEFTRSLRQHLNKSHAQRVSIPGPLAKDKSRFRSFVAPRRLVLIPVVSAALVLLIAVSWWLGHRTEQPLRSSRPPGNAAPKATPNAAGSELPQASETKTLALVLTPGSVRSTEGESKTLAIPPGVTQVRLEARFAGAYPHFQAVIQTAEGRLIWRQGSLTADEFSGGKRVFLTLPSALLTPNDYILTLGGMPASGNAETVAEYAFRVTKK